MQDIPRRPEVSGSPAPKRFDKLALLHSNGVVLFTPTAWSFLRQRRGAFYANGVW